MSQALGLIVDLELAPKNQAADVIINRLDSCGDQLDDEIVEQLLDRFKMIIKDLDSISMEHLKSQIDLKKYGGHETVNLLREDEGALKYKRCLNLVGDAEHLLMMYCLQMVNVTDDKEEWTKVFDEMRFNIFENFFAGPDYRVLEKYKAALYAIAEFDSTDRETKKRVLSSVQSDLRTSKRDSVSLSHVCPELAAKEIVDASLNKLLCLKPGVNVFKFEEKIPIFTDSIRRPAVLSVRLSDGSLRRYIVKRGERVRTHCAAMRLFATVKGGRGTHKGYHVTPLSDDCALIEYLEDHERLRTLIASQYPIDGVVDSLARVKDSELVLAPASALRRFQAACAMVPAHVLRSAVEENSACVEDFIWKKSNFLETLCDMTVFCYLFGKSLVMSLTPIDVSNTTMHI
ncbi:uncharacterized protein LOC124541754 [Vanessa cardui]|uniref:uncharacterized protein LOC124541754 n=1 Tax=Vanessa cardui TaxID=171605 RepID=UPI001F13B9F9|nr:uncharacterized protein LOC124541754 [Vanessa cardui]